MHAHVHTCTYTHVHSYMPIHTCAHAHVHTCMCTRVCTCTHVRACVCICMCSYMRVHTQPVDCQTSKQVVWTLSAMRVQTELSARLLTQARPRRMHEGIQTRGRRTPRGGWARAPGRQVARTLELWLVPGKPHDLCGQDEEWSGEWETGEEEERAGSSAKMAHALEAGSIVSPAS